jgi:hypothetical protein
LGRRLRAGQDCAGNLNFSAEFIFDEISPAASVKAAGKMRAFRLNKTFQSSFSEKIRQAKFFGFAAPVKFRII